MTKKYLGIGNYYGELHVWIEEDKYFVGIEEHDGDVSKKEISYELFFLLVDELGKGDEK